MQAVAAGTWPNIPGAPTIGTATAGPLNASVTFTAPAYVGTGITGYTVTSSPGGVTGTGASSPIVVSGLTAGTAYTFTVTASTAGGTGPASAASNSVTPTPPVYIEETFSTYLYAGNNGSQTIVNGVDLATKGGLVWIKDRTQAASHYLQDTVRGANNILSSNNTNAQSTLALNTVFNTDGFSQNNSFGGFNGSGDNYASWTFRKQPKFFDVVTFSTGATLSSNRSISHNLGSAPGFIIVKSTSNASNWLCYHRSLGQSSYVALQSTNGENTTSQWWTATAPTSTTFNIDETLLLNTNRDYVAYLFAHNAGGFGLTGTDNVITCGSYTANGNNTIELGYEPQFVLIKKSSGDGDWELLDNMRGMPISTGSQVLYANSSAAEGVGGTNFPTSTGFYSSSYGSGTIIYIAIRRGPMKVPTSGTSVFSPNTTTNDNNVSTTGFPVDMFMEWARAGNASNAVIGSRLTGSANALVSSSTAAEAALLSGSGVFSYNTGIATGVFASGVSAIQQNFQRAPSFFDEVCYTGNGSSSSRALNHNLNAVPELIIWKSRSNAVNNWYVYSAALGTGFYVELNLIAAKSAFSLTGGNTPTSSVFYTALSGDSSNNGSGITYVAYLFATCAGVSKVGSYTGTGAAQTINCGFTSGARFVLIKRTDGTGDWYVWDSARGIVSGDDPYLLLNSTAAEVTNTDYVDTYSAGFEISSTAPAAINSNGGSFIFLAIA